MVCTYIGSRWFLRFRSQNKILYGDLVLILTWPIDGTHTEWLRASTWSTNMFSQTSGAEITFVSIKVKTNFLLLAQFLTRFALKLWWDKITNPSAPHIFKGTYLGVHMVVASTTWAPSGVRPNRCGVQNGREQIHIDFVKL